MSRVALRFFAPSSLEGHLVPSCSEKGGKEEGVVVRRVIAHSVFDDWSARRPRPVRSEPIEVRVNPDRPVVSIPLQGDGTDSASKQALRTLRGRLIPATLGRIPGTTVAVTGQTAIPRLRRS
jgi:hypothetical protein